MRAQKLNKQTRTGERMDSSRPVKLSHSIPALSHAPVQTIEDALRMIDRNLPKERRHTPLWRRTRELLTRAGRSKDPRTIEQATAHFERAVRAEAKDRHVTSAS
jgi:hypothetical protein